MAISLTPGYPNGIRHITGDVTQRFYSLSGADGDSFTISGIADILFAIVSPNPASALVTVLVSGNTITFHSTGNWGGLLMVVARVG